MSAGPIALGLDPGLATTGYGVVQLRRTGWEAIAGGVIETEKGLPRTARLADIYREVRALIATYQPIGVAVEEIYLARNARTAMGTAETRGVILLAAHGTPVRGYTPLQVKKRITGYGRANKGQVQATVQQLLSLPQLPKPDDMADGLALALCYLLDLSGVKQEERVYL